MDAWNGLTCDTMGCRSEYFERGAEEKISSALASYACTGTQKGGKNILVGEQTNTCSPTGLDLNQRDSHPIHTGS